MPRINIGSKFFLFSHWQDRSESEQSSVFVLATVQWTDDTAIFNREENFQEKINFCVHSCKVLHETSFLRLLNIVRACWSIDFSNLLLYAPSTNHTKFYLTFQNKYNFLSSLYANLLPMPEVFIYWNSSWREVEKKRKDQLLCKFTSGSWFYLSLIFSIWVLTFFFCCDFLRMFILCSTFFLCAPKNSIPKINFMLSHTLHWRSFLIDIIIHNRVNLKEIMVLLSGVSVVKINALQQINKPSSGGKFWTLSKERKFDYILWLIKFSFFAAIFFVAVFNKHGGLKHG